MKWFREWWRGWSDEDLDSILRKLNNPDNIHPGHCTPVTRRELAAHLAWVRSQYPMLHIKP